ncbi:Purine nucleoside phosphorylase [Tieghemiomyces parasiticus]|uniref:Purine nucleoside phosphorylase n=1 Tax=Tieghemiomyces parasiticus TaxID=78921 RepID=A0A9W7ZYL2_9FUNG|nr:Purine nucleoside phosphorylase [Tieghemiomyces parasiticus]
MATLKQNIPFAVYQGIVDFLRQKVPPHLIPKVGIVCGSGLGGLASTMDDGTFTIDYSDIPNFPQATVSGHAGKLVFGILSGKPTVCLVGRFHFYEGYQLDATTLPLRVMHLLGVETVLVTNATGSLNERFNVGDLVLIKDHVSLPSLAGLNPLVGPNLPEFGPRFPAVSDVYDFDLRVLMAETFYKDPSYQSHGISLHEGVYTFVSGPSYESRAEGRFLRSIGADVVGMSTIPEIITAAHCGLRLLCMSLVTNQVLIRPEPSALDEAKRRLQVGGSAVTAASLAEQEIKATHEEVLAMSATRSLAVEKLVTAFVAAL